MAINKRIIRSNDEAAAGASFNTVTWTGDSTTDRNIDVGFQPDLVWIKSRTNLPFPINHTLSDSVRGSNSILRSNLTDAEVIASTEITSFDSNGFSLGTGASVNFNNDDLVAWCWKAGGAAVSNTDGTITSQVSANPAAGFSIVKYNTSSPSFTTVGHGLQTTPQLIISKSLDIAQNWSVNTSIIDGSWDFAYLNLTDQFNNSSLTLPTSTVFTTGGTAETTDFVSYCFAEVAGFSKFGSYVGTDTRQGIVTGFEPAFVMIKRTDVANSWFMIDNKRFVTNQYDRYLLADSSGAEGGLGSTQYVEFNQSGFSVETGSGLNGSGGTYIYMAFANQF